MSGYWNTTGLTGGELQAAITTAKRQEDAVLAIYRACGTGLTPWEVLAIGAANGRPWLIGSVRRAITNLTTFHGPLTQTSTKRRGPHRASSFVWELMDRAA